MDKGLVVKSIILLTNLREKKPNKTMTAKTKILCPIFESHKLHLKTLPVVLWKASRVQRNTGHSALFSLSKYHPATQGWFAITVLHCAILDVDFPSGMHSPVLRIICLPQ